MKERFRTRYGPWAVVTGASSGIGRELALCLAKRGLNLVLIARRRDVLEELASDIATDYGVETNVIDIDLADEKAAEVVDSKTQHLDVGLLVAAAGYGTCGPFLDAILEQEIDMLYVNCRAILSLSLAFGQRLARRGRGGIILMSSILGFQGMANATHYAATKAYVQAFAEGLHVELAPLGVDVLAAAPGPVHSGFAGRADMRMGMAMRPKDVAQPILNALGRTSTALPGFLSKLIPYSMMPLPRWAKVRLIGMVVGTMTRHKRRKNSY